MISHPLSGSGDFQNLNIVDTKEDFGYSGDYPKYKQVGGDFGTLGQSYGHDDNSMGSTISAAVSAMTAKTLAANKAKIDASNSQAAAKLFASVKAKQASDAKAKAAADAKASAAKKAAEIAKQTAESKMKLAKQAASVAVTPAQIKLATAAKADADKAAVTLMKADVLVTTTEKVAEKASETLEKTTAQVAQIPVVAQAMQSVPTVSSSQTISTQSFLSPVISQPINPGVQMLSAPTSPVNSTRAAKQAHAKEKQTFNRKKPEVKHVNKTASKLKRAEDHKEEMRQRNVTGTTTSNSMTMETVKPAPQVTLIRSNSGEDKSVVVSQGGQLSESKITNGITLRKHESYAHPLLNDGTMGYEGDGMGFSLSSLVADAKASVSAELAKLKAKTAADIQARIGQAGSNLSSALLNKPAVKTAITEQTKMAAASSLADKFMEPAFQKKAMIAAGVGAVLVAVLAMKAMKT